MAGLTTKFAVGDKVFRSGTMTIRKQHPCPDCKGTRKWQATSPAGGVFEMACPRCTERYRSEEGLSLEYSEFIPAVNTLTIGSIRVDTNDADRPVSYMCRETGIGSGTIHYEADLHATEEEAQAVAEEKAKTLNATTDWVVKQYNKTVSLSDYQLSDATLKSARNLINSHSVKLEMLFADLRDCETVERVKEVLDTFTLRDAA